MFEFGADKAPQSKCYLTHGTLPHLDPSQPPQRSKPFSSVLARPFYHKAELILPAEIYELVKDQLLAKCATPKFSRVIMALKDVVDGEFFTEYIKRGNVLMLSEGRPGIDNKYMLKDGVLSLSLDKETYERAGLVGKPEGTKGKRGGRSRWVVKLDLRQPSMLHGKKGFERIVYAFKNVLTTPVTWLFSNLEANVPSSDPLAKYFPAQIECLPKESPKIPVRMPNVQVPREALEDRMTLEEVSIDLYEWLSMISLESPRLDVNDTADPYLSRYSPPAPADESEGTTQLIKVTWSGFLSARWAHGLLFEALTAVPKGNWVAFSVCGFTGGVVGDSRDMTLLKVPGTPAEYLMWQIDPR